MLQAGTYSITVIGTLNDPSSAVASSSFNIVLIEIVTSSITATIEILLGDATDKVETFTAWYFNPTSTFTLTLSVFESSDGITPAPAWISTTNGAVTVAYATAVAGTYSFKVKGTVNPSGEYALSNAFTVNVIDLAPSTLVDQIYIIDGTASNYVFPPYTCTSYCAASGETIVYTIENTAAVVGTGTDPVATQAWMTSFNALTQQIDFSTSDKLLANEYQVTVIGTLSVSTSTKVSASFKFYLISMTAATQTPIVYLLGNTALVHPIA